MAYPMTYVYFIDFDTVPTFNCSLNARASRATARLIATKFPGHGCMDDLTTKRIIYSHATCVIDVICLCVEILFMGVYTTRYRQASGRLVQKLNVCTVDPSSCLRRLLTLPMLRLLSSKAQGRKDFHKPSEIGHAGIHWKAFAEYFQMSTYLPWFR